MPPQPLSKLTTLRLGGAPDRLLVARTEDELVHQLSGVDAAGDPVLILAGGSNVVVSDDGFRGTVVLVRTRGVEEVEGSSEGRTMRIQAGEDWDEMVARAVDEGLSGIECLSGIPGSVGAVPIQNVGAYGQEVAETIVGVRVLDRARREVYDLAPEACDFAYRSSAFKGRDRHAVLSVDLRLRDDPMSAPIGYSELARVLGVEVGGRVPLREAREAVLALRRGKGMVVDASDPESVSCGSFFTNPLLEPAAFRALEERVAEALGGGARPPGWAEDGMVKTSAAWLIERAGFERGLTRGGVGISRKHTLALVNRGGTTAELVALAREIAAAVGDRFGVELTPEPMFVGHAWKGG